MMSGDVISEVILRAVLFAVYLWTDLQQPFTRVIQPEERWLYRNPYTEDVTVSTPNMFFVVVLVPSVLIIACGIFIKKFRDTRSALLGLTMSLLLNGCITNGIKLMVGRPRPDFFARCFPDGNEVYEGVAPVCSGALDAVIEGRKSFPSGHSSWSFAGLLFLSYYLAGKLQCFSQPPPRSLLKLIISFIPSCVALWIALTRYNDYWHHWQDITIGSIIGAGIATLSYFYYFPALWDPSSHLYRDYSILDNTSVIKKHLDLPRSRSETKMEAVKIM